MLEPNAEARRLGYPQTVARAWSDPGFKAKLLSDPLGVLTEAGIELPRHMSVKLLENTADVLHLVLPTEPAENKLSGTALEQTAPIWMNPTLKAKLLSDPLSALAEAGVDLPAHMTIKLVENTANVLHLVLPAEPAEDELTDADLEQTVGLVSHPVSPCCCRSKGITT